MNYSKDNQNEIIKKSHERSIDYGIEKNRVFPKMVLKQKEMDDNIEKNEKLLNIATPFIEDLFDFLVGSEFFIILTDNEGCILKIIGDVAVLKIAHNLNMVVGAYMSENSIGTNAMGTTIKEDIPIQISEKEHFIEAYHRWTCSAAPIHDGEGNIIGCLNLTGAGDKVHSHTLGLVVAAVKSIENQIKMENTNYKLMETYQYMNTILDSISSGIFVVNREGIVKTINVEACNILGIKEEQILEKKVNPILPNWVNIFERIKLGKLYDNRESILSHEAKNERYNMTATPILNENEVIGMVVIFREMQKVLNLVNKYTGGRAIYTFDDIVGDSKEIRRVINYAKTISSSPSTVLIQGESGTGKELMAQSIHNYSNRKNNSFIAVNCGAIPKSLIESELFGYEEGAFTGARRGGHSGKFELANGGTLFLDEIGEMPLDMQVNLLRVLQEGYVTRVGGDKIIPVDVRIIAATNKNLKEEVEKGGFREDLFYRISVIPVDMPALRDREGDLPILIRYLFKSKAKKLNKQLESMNADIYLKMMNYNWPGNIRELENCIENIVNLNGESSMFLQEIEKYNDKKIFDRISTDSNPELVLTLEELEEKEIAKALDFSCNNMSKTAKLLGITRSTLYSKIKKYKLN